MKRPRSRLAQTSRTSTEPGAGRASRETRGLSAAEEEADRLFALGWTADEIMHGRRRMPDGSIERAVTPEPG